MARPWLLLGWALAAALCTRTCLAQTRIVNALCAGGYKGFETGFLVAVMPPDVRSPQGGLVQAGGLLVVVVAWFVSRVAPPPLPRASWCPPTSIADADTK
jgi:hypothetical protein